MSEKRTLSVKELAEYMGIGTNQAYNLTKEKGFPILMIGKRIIIPVDLLEKWIGEQVNK